LFGPLGEVDVECAIHHEQGVREDLRRHIYGASKRRIKSIFM